MNGLISVDTGLPFPILGPEGIDQERIGGKRNPRVPASVEGGERKEWRPFVGLPLRWAYCGVLGRSRAAVENEYLRTGTSITAFNGPLCGSLT